MSQLWLQYIFQNESISDIGMDFSYFQIKARICGVFIFPKAQNWFETHSRMQAVQKQALF